MNGITRNFRLFRSFRVFRGFSVRWPVVALVVLLGGGWLVASAAAKLNLREARIELQSLLGAELKPEQVQIKSIKSGQGDNVIVEAQFETAFRFTRIGREDRDRREGRNWRVAEIRLGDRQWESIELIEEAVRREKARRTGEMLSRIAAGLDNYRRSSGGYVAADEVGRLLDELFPRYLTPIVRFDLWGTPLGYKGTAEHYRLTSAGPDRLPGTDDDLILEDGVLKPWVAQTK